MAVSLEKYEHGYMEPHKNGSRLSPENTLEKIVARTSYGDVAIDTFVGPGSTGYMESMFIVVTVDEVRCPHVA